MSRSFTGYIYHVQMSCDSASTDKAITCRRPLDNLCVGWQSNRGLPMFRVRWPVTSFFTFFFLLTRSHLTLGCSFQTRKIKANNRMVAIISRPFLQSPLWYKIGCQGTLLWPSWVTISRWWTGRSAPGESLASAHRHTHTDPIIRFH